MSHRGWSCFVRMATCPENGIAFLSKTSCSIPSLLRTENGMESGFKGDNSGLELETPLNPVREEGNAELFEA